MTKSRTALLRELVVAAKSTLRMAYSPYSRIRVGSAVLGSDGVIYTGCNVENASYGATICAERTAIVKAISEGNREIAAIAIVTESADPWPPCGMCRQVLLEFAKPTTPVILASTKGRTKRVTLGKLAPMSFTPTRLKK